jgi:hypothetical protein
MDHLTIQNGQRTLGGAVYINRGSVFFDSSVFRANDAQSRQSGIFPKGGAIYNREGCLHVSGGSQFDNNSANNIFVDPDSDSIGGGIFNSNGFLLVVNSTFTENRSVKGGAIGIRRSMGAEGREGVVISGSGFTLNHSVADAGAIYAEGEKKPL